MQVNRSKAAAYTACGVLTIAVFFSVAAAPPYSGGSQAAPHEITLDVDPAQSKVHYMVDSSVHTVHGSFELKKGSTVHFDPETGKAGGEVAVYATSGESGNSSRDQRMHKEILETEKYPDALFRPGKVEGKVARNGTSDVQLQGVMTLHGANHEIVAFVHMELGSDHWTGTAKFDVPYIQWGIKDPSNWLLKVKPVVSIEIDMAGPLTGAK
jgi:polyisoprenoid-binding protein YceI